MSATQTATRTDVPRAPAEEEPYYTNRPNARPRKEEAVPSAEWTRWRLYKQRPDIKDKFPEYFPDVRQQLYDRLNAEVQADKERIPIPPRFRKRSLGELKEDYTPTQLGFAPLTDFYDEVNRQNARLSRRQRIDSDEEGDKIPSLWFERMAQDLFARVWEFCSDTFGLDESLPEESNLTGKLNDYDWTLRWLDKLPKEFVVLASQVARGDMTVVEAKTSDPTNWEFLFLDPKSRVKLVVGVMAKLLEKNLFNSLLVGAADVEKTALEADDHARAFLENSYQRNRTRSETVRNYIQANRPPYGIGLVDLWTDNFWDEVDSVTMGILDLLLPLINLLGYDMPDIPWPPLKQIHQGLHDIVAEAAWFANGMRATRSVFWIQFPLAGELSDISHDHAIADIWDRSKVKAEAHDIAEYDKAREAALSEEHKKGIITPEHRAAYEAKNPRPYIRRTAKVQVAMWPFIKRFTPMGERDAGDGAYNNGETITQIMKAQCVYYYGDDADAADINERRTLSEQIRERRRETWWARRFTWRAVLIYALIFGLFLLVTSPEFQQELDRYSQVGKSSSSSQGSERATKTTTVVAVPVGTEIITQTIVVTETKGDEDRSWFKFKGPSVTTVTETVTETILREVDGRADNDEYYDSAEDSESSDDENVNGGSGFVSKGKGIAASLVSAKDKVSEGILSAKDNIVSEFASTTDRLAASASSEWEKLASIDSSVRESVTNSIADDQSRISAASQKSADESSSSLAASKNSVIESRASKEASKSSERASREASRSSADASRASSRSSAEASKSSSRSSAEQAKSSRKQSKESSRSSEAARKSAEAEAKKAADDERSAAAERSAAEESRIVSERVAASLASEASLAAEEEASRTAASIASEEEEKARSSSSSASKERAGSRKTVPKGSGTDATTVTIAGRPVSVEDITTGEVSMLTEEEKETITITVPADKVVVTVTGPVTQAETQGAVKTAVDKASKLTEGWSYVTECFQTSWSFWKFLRYLWTQYIGPNPLSIVFVLLLFVLWAKKLFDYWLRVDGPAIGG